MASVPEDLYLEILLRVSVKSSYVCKCVCKSWFQIISNPSFVKKHLDISMQRRNYSLIFESSDVRQQSHSTVNSISYDSLSSLNGSESEIVELVDYPFSVTQTWKCISTKVEEQKLGDYRVSSYSYFQFLGSCDGLICIRHSRSICICNPATKEYKRIPKPNSRDTLFDHPIMNHAFGYDCKASDYKLINMVECGGQEFLDVYTLGSNSWESTQIVHYTFPCKGQTGILVNGAFHWFGRERKGNSTKLIVSMDVSSEKFDEVRLPEEIIEEKHSSMTIGVLEGCLCLIVLISAVRYEVLMMRESWFRLHIIEDETIITGAGYSLRLLRSFENGQILLKYGNWLVTYDPKHSRGRETKILSSLRLHDAIDYVESLVSLNSGTYARRNNKMVGTSIKRL